MFHPCFLFRCCWLVAITGAAGCSAAENPTADLGSDSGAVDSRVADGRADARRADGLDLPDAAADGAGDSVPVAWDGGGPDGACPGNFTGPGCSQCKGAAVGPVLFIGNSYTAANALHTLVAGFVDDKGCAVDFVATTPGGYTFKSHAADAKTQALIRSRKWQAIILQNQSQVPGWKVADVTSKSLPHAKTLAMIAREKGATPRLVYLMTWGRRDGDAANCGYYPLVCTFTGHTQALKDGYAVYVTGTGGELAPAGLAWAAARADTSVPFTPTDLWAPDGSHPALRGSYLAAAVLYRVLSGKTPVGNAFSSTLGAIDATYLKKIAAAAVGP